MCIRDRGLTIVERLDSGKSSGVLFEKVGELYEELATVLGGDLSPASLEGLTSGGNGNVDILLGSFLNRANDLLVRWVDGLKGFVVDTLDPLAVNEARLRSVSVLWCSDESTMRNPHSQAMGNTHSPVGCSYLPVEGVSS